jgi:hypothetical protein
VTVGKWKVSRIKFRAAPREKNGQQHIKAALAQSICTQRTRQLSPHFTFETAIDMSEEDIKQFISSEMPVSEAANQYVRPFPISHFSFRLYPRGGFDGGKWRLAHGARQRGTSIYKLTGMESMQAARVRDGDARPIRARL